MTGKFDNVPVDDDTRIILQLETRLGPYDVLYQKWVWDGITAESLIFSNEDIAGIDEEDLIREVRASPWTKGDTDITVKQSESGYTFVNFNFEVD